MYINRIPAAAFGRRFWPELLILFWPALYFWPLLLGTRRLFWGLPLLQFVPWRVLVRQSIWAGHLPLWTERLGMGAPLLANLQSAVFYPPNWLALLLPPDYVVGLLVVLHLGLAGLGMVRLARHLGLDAHAAAIAGLAFGFSDYLVARLWFVSINNAVAWLPWILLAADRTARGRRRSAIALAMFVALQLYAGHAQTSFYTLLIAATWTLWRVWRARAVRSALIVLAGVVFGFMLAAVQLLPTAELLTRSPRAAAAGYEFAATYSLWPWRLISFVAPTFFGHPADGSYWAYPTYWEDAAYIGVLPLALAVVTIGGALWRIARRQVHKYTSNQVHKEASTQVNAEAQSTCLPVYLPTFLAGVALFSVLLALGKFAPFFPFFYRYMPGFNLFQAPARMLIGYVFAMSLLAGLGAHALRPSARLRYWSRLALAGAALIALFGIVLQLTAVGGLDLLADAGLDQERLRGLAWMGRSLTVAGLAVGAFALLLLRRKEPRTRMWTSAAVLLVVVDLGLAARGLNPLVDPALYTTPSAKADALRGELDGGRVFMFPADEYRVRFERFFDLSDFGGVELDRWLPARAWLLPNLAALDGIDSANNFDPLLPALHADYMDSIEAASPSAADNLLRAAGVGAVISSDDLTQWPLLLQSGDVRVYVVAGGARVRFVSQACRVSTNAEARAMVASAAFDPDALAVLLDPDGASGFESCPAREPAGSGSGPGSATIVPDNDPNKVQIETEGAAPGLVVLADTDYPGWRALVDGRPVAYYRAEGAFRAAPVPAGAHTVEFRYEPASFRVGAWVSIIALVIWIGAFVAGRRTA